MVSLNSARSLTCTAPVAAQNACHAAASPASAPEWAADHGPSPRRTADGQDHHRHILPGGAQQRLAQSGNCARCLEKQSDDPGFGVVECVVDVVGGVGDDLLP